MIKSSNWFWNFSCTTLCKFLTVLNVQITYLQQPTFSSAGKEINHKDSLSLDILFFVHLVKLQKVYKVKKNKEMKWNVRWFKQSNHSKCVKWQINHDKISTSLCSYINMSKRNEMWNILLYRNFQPFAFVFEERNIISVKEINMFSKSISIFFSLIKSLSKF